MPYDEGQAKATTPPRLQTVHQRLEKINAQQNDIIAQIEGRLHSLLNKRTPEDAEKRTEKMNPNDAISALNFQLDITEANTITMQRILNHLQEIV